jgi:hypothetical protein
MTLIWGLSWAMTGWASSCRFQGPPRVLPAGDATVLQYWNFQDDSILRSESLPDLPSFSSYRKAVQARLNVDPLSLLDRYFRIGIEGGDAYNLDVVRNDSAHFIRPIRCLEALLLDAQIERTPKMLVAPTELLAFYLRHPDGRLRVYYLTDDLAGIWKMESLSAKIHEDLQEGWIVIGNLHNHSFFLDHLEHPDVIHPQGVLSPSANDMQVLKEAKSELGLQSALITNGFNTIEIPASEFGRFREP